ncbi:hypothetical protein O181_040344 [Austropuccinia psidii MF-1]|uniref:Uncharacterized protein n=1 Tax=Austropuccinia psidii MF-1 TaxID=1389203 RepID=A0A9Q3DC23_9BASI|nr:hypothetical protein [Austropuccinia psidii MF-1]
MDITLELDPRYHERQKEEGSNQEKKPPVSGYNSSRPPQDSSLKKPNHKKSKKGKNFQVSKDKIHASLLNKDKKSIFSEKERRIKEGLCTYCDGKHPIEKCLKRPENRTGSSRGFLRKLITYDYSCIFLSTGNESATAVKSVALVGEIKKPYIPSSVHIPPIIPCKSLLKSRNEVLKVIKDVGEDDAISSLCLFQGVMDFPILSFHSSLEEQWDEEEEKEEIETVSKVVPPAYNKYLYVVSKVKAEKLPPKLRM